MAKDKAPEKTGNPSLDARAERLYESTDHDKKRLRIALGIALAAHLIFLAVRLPAMMDAPPPPEDEDEPTYIIQQVKFKPPPPPEPEPEKPKPPEPEARKIPVPDPTPREPEPVPEPEPEPEPPDPEDVVEFVDKPMARPPQPDLPKVDTAVEIPKGPPPPPEPTGPIRVGGNVKAPVKVSGQDPDYTPSARAAKITGVVIIEAIIDKRGNVTSTKVVKDLPMGLASNAERAVKAWKFRPATLNGKPVEVYYNLTVNFRLN